MGETLVDTVVIGAGAAGLAAARELAAAGKNVCVVEARDRTGGRCLSAASDIAGLPVELGAEFIHGTAQSTYRILDEMHGVAVDVPEARWFVRAGRLRRGSDAFERIMRAFARTTSLRGQDRPFAEFIAGFSARALPADARRMALMMVEGLDAADPALISAREVVAEWSGDIVSDQQARPLGGYGALMAFLAGALRACNVDLRLSCMVDTVHWREGEVRVMGSQHGNGMTVRARHAIVTLPLDLLRIGAAGAVEFHPPLADKRWALEHLASGPVVKLVMQFDPPFWEQLARGRYRDASFFHDARGHFPTFWTGLPLRTSFLTAWAGGPKALALHGMDRESLVRLALSDLRRIFKSTRVPRHVKAAWHHDWQADQFARGAYSYVKAGGARARRRLAAPLGRTLHFAGEATDFSGEATTVGGAILSGLRAAREILSARPDSESFFIPPRKPD